MNQPSLVILAAGMGSRYGGLKQIDTVGDNGESIIDFTVYDAIEAGFKKVYLIIRKEHEEAFDKALVNQVRPFIEVEYIYQDKNDLPEGYACPEGREKPWGTTHALLACRNQVKEPFMICNADDYYGKDAFKRMYTFLTNEVHDDHYCLVGYRLVNTLSDSGSVTRGVCEVEDGILSAVNEIQKIKRQGDQVVCSDDGETWRHIDENKLVSMNFWGFTPKIFDLAQKQFLAFLEKNIAVNPLKCEHVIPTMIGETLKDKSYVIEALPSENTWFGVTYQEDKPFVVAQFKAFKETGAYPHNLWEQK